MIVEMKDVAVYRVQLHACVAEDDEECTITGRSWITASLITVVIISSLTVVLVTCAATWLIYLRTIG